MEDRRWLWALRASAVAVVLPLWSVRFLPFADMPEQVAVISSFRHWFDPAFRVQEHFTFAFGRSQYVLYHLTGAAIAWVVGDAERANLILLTVAGLAYPYALRELLRALGRDERLALFGAPAFWSRALLFGFAPYVASVPLVTYAAAQAIRQEEAPTKKRAVGLTFLALALFYMHANAYLLFVGIAVGLVLVSRRWNRARILGAARSLVYLLPSMSVAGGWAAWGALGKLSISERPTTANLPRSELLRELPLWAHDPFRSHVDEALTAVLWLSLVTLLILRRAPIASSARERMALVPLAIAVLTYFTLPWRMGAGVMLNVRLAVFVVLYAPLLVRPARGPWTSGVFVVAAVAGILFGADAMREVRVAEREEIGDLNRLIDRMPMGTRVLELPFRESSRVSHWMAWQFMGAYHRARRGGVSSYTFSDLAHWPIQFRPGAGPPRKAKFVWTLDSCLYRNAVDGPYYDFVLVRGNVDPFRDAPPGPRFVRIDTELDWNLYARAPGEENPAWDVEDKGPCESREALEHARQTLLPDETPREIPKTSSDERDAP